MCNSHSPIHLSNPCRQVNATTFQDRRENMYPFFRRVDSSREAALVFIALQPWRSGIEFTSKWQHPQPRAASLRVKPLAD